MNIFDPTKQYGGLINLAAFVGGAEALSQTWSEVLDAARRIIPAAAWEQGYFTIHYSRSVGATPPSCYVAWKWTPWSMP